MVQEELKKVDGVSADQIPHLVRTLGPILMQEAEKKKQEIALGPNREPGPLTDVENARIDYFNDVSTTMSTDAVRLIESWTNLNWKFADVAALLPEYYSSDPDLLERFQVLTDLPAQRDTIKRLAAAVRNVASHMHNLTVEHRQAVYQGIGDLLAHGQLPTSSSVAREFVYFACAGLVDSSVGRLPKVAGAPQLRTLPALHTRSAIASPSGAKDTSTTPTRGSASASAGRNASSSALKAAAGASTSPAHASASSSMAVDAPATSPGHGSGSARNSIISPLALDQIEPAGEDANAANSARVASTASACGPSYTQRPASYVPPICSSRDALGNSVLNDYFHCAGAGSEGSPQAHDYIRNNAQEALFRLEEDALCLDILIGRAQSTVRVLDEIAKRLDLLAKHRSVAFTNTVGRFATHTTVQAVINASLLPTHIETFKVITKTRTSMTVDPVAHFVGDPERFILEMKRLVMFHADEHGRARQAFGKLWRQAFAKNYLLSLDHRVYRMKFDDKYTVNSKAVLASMNAKFLELFIAGREWSVDFLEALDFTHYRYSVLPSLNATKSERYKEENPRKRRKNGVNEVVLMDSNIISEEILIRFEDDILALLTTGSERLLPRSEAADLRNWLSETFTNLIRRPDARNWSSNYAHVPNVFYGLPQMAVVVKMYHTLHERVRLAFYLANTFDGHCWDFAASARPDAPSKKKIPEPSKRFPYFDTVAGDMKEPIVDEDFDEHPPTPMFELSTFFQESHPNYIQTWEYETAGVGQRLTRSGAHSSTSVLLSGPPPLSNTHLTNTLLRQAATLRNTPWPTNPFSDNPVEVDSGDGYDPNDLAPASMPPLSDPAFDMENHKRYSSFLQLVTDTLNGKLTASCYELAILKLLGTEAFPLYSLHRLITNLVSAIHSMMSLPGRQVWYEIWAEQRRRLLQNQTSDPQVVEQVLTDYRKAAYEAAGERKFVEFHVSPTGTITYHLRQIAKPPHRANGRGGHHHGHGHHHHHNHQTNWEAYITSWNSPRPDAIRLSKRRVFLQRNITSRLPEGVRSEPLLGRVPSWNLAQGLSDLREASGIVTSKETLFATIDPETYKLMMEAEAPNVWLLSKHRKSARTRSQASTDAPNSRLHRLMKSVGQKYSERYGKKEGPPLSKQDVQNQLAVLESIIAGESARPDHEDPVESLEFDTVSSRTRNAANGSPVDADSDIVSINAEGDSDAEPSHEGSSFADDESVRMQVD